MFADRDSAFSGILFSQPGDNEVLRVFHYFIVLKSFKYFYDLSNQRILLQKEEVTLEEENEPLDIRWPQGCRRRITYVLVAPLIFPLWITIPDVRRPVSVNILQPNQRLGTIYSAEYTGWNNLTH